MLDKLKKWFSHLLDRFAQQYTLPASEYDLAIARWSTLDPPGVEVYRDIREIEVPFKTIDVYCDELKRLLHCLKHDLHYKLPADAVMTRIRVLDFYQTHQHEVLRVPLYYEQLRSQAVMVLSAYERLSASVEKSGQLQSTLYNAAPLEKNLMDLSQGLLVR